MTVTGLAIGSRQEPVGTELTADAPVGATVLSVEWAEPFSDEGGTLQLNGEDLDYTTSDDELDTITLAAPLATAAAAGDTVYVVDGGQVQIAYELDIDLGDGDPVPVPIPFEQRDLWPIGDYTDPVQVQIGADLQALVDVPQRTPSRDLSFAIPATLDDAIPPEPPASSPAVTVHGLLETFLLWSEQVATGTWITFQASSDAGATWADLPGLTNIRSTGPHEAKTLPSGDPFATGTAYQFRTIASNNAGSAAPSAAVTAQLNTSAAQVVATLVAAAKIFAGHAQFGTVNLGGDDFVLSPVDDPVNPLGGMRILLTGGKQIHVPATLTAPTRLIDAEVETLTATDGIQVAGTSQLSGPATLSDSTLPDPTTAPAVFTYYPNKQLVNGDNLTGLCPGGLANEDAALDIPNQKVLRFDQDGIVANEQPLPAGAVGIANDLQFIYVLAYSEEGWKAHRWTKNTVDPTGVVVDLALGVTTDTSRATFGAVGSFLVAAVESHDGTAWSGTVEVTAFTIDIDTNAVTVADTVSLPSPGGALGGVWWNALDRWWLHPVDGDVRVYDDSAVRQAAEEWPRPFGKPVRGLSANGTGTQVFTLDEAGVRRELFSLANAPAATYGISHTWDDGVHTTLTSPEATYPRPARAGFLVSTAKSTGYRVYASSPPGGTKNLQAPANPFVAVNLASGGDPVANTWTGAVTPGEIAATTGGFSIDGESNGSPGTGTFHAAILADIDAAIDALIAAAPAALDTLDELAAALGDDANFASTVTTALAGKQPLDADLTAIAALNTTAYGRAFLALADQAALMALLSAATDAAAGIVELATTTETTTGTDATRAVTPAGLAGMLDAMGHIERACAATQNIATATTTTVLWPTSTVAGRGGISYDGATGVFTVTEPGTYMVKCYISLPNGGGPRRQIQIRRNSVTGAQTNQTPPTTGVWSTETTELLDCAANDTFDVRVFQDSGGALAVSGTITIHRIA